MDSHHDINRNPLPRPGFHGRWLTWRVYGLNDRSNAAMKDVRSNRVGQVQHCLVIFPIRTFDLKTKKILMSDVTYVSRLSVVCCIREKID